MTLKEQMEQMGKEMERRKRAKLKALKSGKDITIKTTAKPKDDNNEE